MSKVKTDPRLVLIDFVKPNGKHLKVNSFPASIEAACALGWLPKKEYDAAAAAVKKAAAAAAAVAPKKAPAGKK